MSPKAIIVFKILLTALNSYFSLALVNLINTITQGDNIIKKLKKSPDFDWSIECIQELLENKKFMH